MSEEILNEIRNKINQTNSLQDLTQIKISYLGKNGLISNEMKKLGTIKDKEEKKIFGQNINNIKIKLQTLINEKENILKEKLLEEKLKNEWIDLSLSPRKYSSGKIHPITQATEELIAIFGGLGFSIEEGPNIENNWYNFSALNIDENHPARQMHDTFYLNTKDNEEAKLLRTHTSPVQIRAMQNASPPLRFIAPGRTYRADSDATHTPMFHQLECVYIDKKVTIGNLKYVINHVIKRFFEQDNIEISFRPSFFPFTEPSMEVDIKMPNSNKWLEVLGCGMIHPQILKNVNIDSKKYNGFAFGLGIDRLAMLKYNINDLREFFSNEIDWIQHYGFSSYDIPSLIRGLTK